MLIQGILPEKLRFFRQLLTAVENGIKLLEVKPDIPGEE